MSGGSGGLRHRWLQPSRPLLPGSGSPRRRIEAHAYADSLLATTLRWTLDSLAQVRTNAMAAYPDVDLMVRRQLDAAARAVQRAPLTSAPSLRPGRHDLIAIRGAGAPWGAVAEIADELRVLDMAPEVLAAELLMPDDAVRWRLFHLAVLGELLWAARGLGCSVRSLEPLRGGSRRPAFLIEDQHGHTWDLWFEAAGIWAQLGVRAPYAEATDGMSLKERALGADLLMTRRGGPSLVLECKYSANPEFVARNGYYQAVAYAAELTSRTGAYVTAAAIGPEGIVGHVSFTNLVAGRIGTCPPSAIRALLEEFLSQSDRTRTST